MSLARRLVLIVLGIGVLILGGGYLYLFQLGGLESIALAQINKALPDDSRLSVSLGAIEGDLISGLTLRELVVTYRDSVQTFEFFSVAEMMATYSVSDLWSGDYIFENVHLDGLRGRVARTPEGDWLIPIPAASGGAKAGRLNMRIERLSLSRGNFTIVRANDTLLIENLDLVASLESDQAGFALEIERCGFDASQVALTVNSLSGAATVSGGNLVVQDILLGHGDTRLKVSGVVNLQEQTGQLEFTVDALDLGELCSVVGGKLKGVLDVGGRLAFDPDKMEGRVNLGGDFHFVDLENLSLDFSMVDRVLVFDSLYGSIMGGCNIDGSAWIDLTEKPESYYLEAEVTDFDLSHLIRGSFASDLNGHIVMDGFALSKRDMYLKLDVDLFESSFDQYPLHTAVGRIDIAGDSMVFHDRFRVDYFENVFLASGVIAYRDQINLDLQVDLQNLDRYRGRLFIDQPGGRGFSRATLSGRTNDPDLTGTFTSDSLWLYGFYASDCLAEFSIDRFLSGRQGWVQANFLDGNAWPVPYDTARLVLHLDSVEINLDTVHLTSPHLQMATRGRLDQGQYPWLLALDTLDLSVLERPFYNRDRLRVNIDSLGFDFRETSIGQGAALISLDGRVDFDESMAVTVAANDIPIAPWLHLFDTSLELDARLSGVVDLAGTFQAPVFDLSGALDSIVYREIPLGDLSIAARYHDRLLTVDSLVVQAHPGWYRAEGQFHTDLAFTTDLVNRLPDLPFDLAVKATDQRFDLVSLFLPNVEEMNGDFFADFRLHGTPGQPHLDGLAYLKDGRLKYFDLADTILTDSAGVRMQDNKIIIDEIELYVWDKRKKRNSYAYLDGELTVKALDSLHYDIGINLPKEFPFKYDLDDVHGVIEGELHVFGDTPPTVTGDLTLISGKYQVEFADDEAGSPLMLALSGENTWDLNINIDILSNYWIKNEDIDAEFSGFMNFIREDGQYRFIGDLDVLKGRGYLFDKTFRIEPNSRVVFEDIEYPNPRLDIYARTRIPVARAENEERSDVELGIHVTGTLENPEFGTTEAGESDSAFSRESILPLIVANYYGQEAGAGAFEERISQLISSQVSQISTRKFGVETFEIDPTYKGTLDLAQTRVTLGGYTSPNLYLYGSSPVSFESRQEYGFEYRLKKSFLLEGSRDEDEYYHLNLKLHLEF